MTESSGGGSLGPASPFTAALSMTLHELKDRVGLDAWLVARRDGEDYVVLEALDEVLGHRSGTVRAWSDTYCSAMFDGAPMVAHDVSAVDAYVQVRARSGMPIGSYIGVPITDGGGQVVGALCGVGLQPASDSLADVLPTVQDRAGMLGMLFSQELDLAAQTRRAERAENAARTDPLTGACNRRAWDAALSSEEARASRHASSVSVLVLDLDELKHVNDKSGHHAGDELLRRTAGLLRKHLSEGDLLARLGGDEFGMLLPGTDERDARRLADQLAAALRRAGIGASLGVAGRHAGTGLSQAWKDADGAMYAGKLRTAQQASVTSASELDGEAVAPSAEWQLRASPEPGQELGSVDALLNLARDQLGMDVAFLNRFDGENRTIRNLQTSVELPIEAGFTEAREGSYCQAIVDGRLDPVIPDTRANPYTVCLPVTDTLRIGSYIGVPLHTSDGSLYGTLCAYSTGPDHTLQTRDTKVLSNIGKILMPMVEQEDSELTSRGELLGRLDALHAAGGPRIVYQPIVTLDGLEPVGMEALSRFPAGSPPPDQWFAAAADAGQGHKLELLAIRNALRALPRIDGFLAVNVSSSTISTPAFARLLDGVPLRRLVLEVTEHEQISDYAALATVLQPLRQQGLLVAVDDAGAGFASLRHILTLVPDLIKLDISLIRGVDTDHSRQALAAAISTFAVRTGAAVIAEGVETADELDVLRSLSIPYGQGYHLGRPAPVPEA